MIGDALRRLAHLGDFYTAVRSGEPEIEPPPDLDREYRLCLLGLLAFLLPSVGVFVIEVFLCLALSFLMAGLPFYFVLGNS